MSSLLNTKISLPMSAAVIPTGQYGLSVAPVNVSVDYEIKHPKVEVNVPSVGAVDLSFRNSRTFPFLVVPKFVFKSGTTETTE